MISMALYKREMKGSIKLLIIFGAIITLYVSIIINMYDPQMMKTLDSFVEAMPELMASVGMKAAAANLLGFMVSYLYGFIRCCSAYCAEMPLLQNTWIKALWLRWLPRL